MTNEELIAELAANPQQVAPNRYGATTDAVITVIEQAFIEARAAMMPETTTPASVTGLQHLHKYLLQDVYDHPIMSDKQEIHDVIGDEYAKMATDMMMKLATSTGWPDRYVGIVAGRLLAMLTHQELVTPAAMTDCLFVDQLARNTGHTPHWDRINSDEMLDAQLSFVARRDLAPIETTMTRLLASGSEHPTPQQPTDEHQRPVEQPRPVGPTHLKIQ